MRWIKDNKNIMESKELRIGNHVLKGKDIVRIKGMRNYGNMPMFLTTIPNCKKSVSSRWWTNETLKPIPLTEEWLERLGFTKVNHKGINGYLSGNCELIYNIESKQMFSFNEVDGSVWNLTRVIFIHQLQNLYFALTGEELKYSLNYTPNKEES